MRKKVPKVICEKEVDTIHIMSGQTLTVWLQNGQAGELKREQVELRVDFAGNMEIFTDMSVKKFKDWKSIYDDY